MPPHPACGGTDPPQNPDPPQIYVADQHCCGVAAVADPQGEETGHGSPHPQASKGDRALATSRRRRTPVDEWLPLTEVLEELDITRATWYRWRNRGYGPKAHRLPNGHIRVRRSALDAFNNELEAA
ncbi:helix-turn-helix transcriptional regulator [Streptomyces sp. NPDC001513]|uniref:helix-turn-helix transcriptional regulator n=1 Tax=Streptomyces sp. NPDC001513 TaxID=3364580 RepID=UPI0036AAD3AA